MNLFYLLLFIIGVAVIFPIFLIWAFFYFTKVGFEYLDVSLGLGVFFFFLVLIGSFINIPLGKRRLVKVNESQFFGLFYKPVWRNQGVSINVGGALIPLFVVGYFFSYIPIEPVLISAGVVALFSFIGARYVEKKGVLLSIFLPVLFAVFFALLLSPDFARETAFSSAVLGVLFGADLLHLPQILIKKGGVMAIGGAGVFDGIFLAGVISALLAGMNI